MKAYSTTYFLFATVAAVLLHLHFNYPVTTAAYHLLVMTLFFGVLYGVGLLLSLIPRPGLRRWLHHGWFFAALTSTIIFYVLILGSNATWKKSITVAIIRNYFFSIDQLVNNLPVQKGLLVAAVLVLLVLLILLYRWVRPRVSHFDAVASGLAQHRTRFLLAAAGVALTAFLLRGALVDVKRRAHFAEEPVLIFALGSMWSSGGEWVVFERQRYENGLRDQACMDAIKRHPGDSSRNVMIILADALRADHLPVYGYGRPTTPFLDSLRQAGKLSVVRNAFSPANNTVCGIANLFFSKDWDQFGYNGLNIPKYLRRIGYRNYAFLTGFHKEWYGLAALYRNDCDVYYESSMNFEDRDQKIDDDMRTLEEVGKYRFDGSNFIYVHLLSTHEMGRKYDQFRKFLPDKFGIGVGRTEALVNNYDNGVLQFDDVVRRLFGILRQQGVLERTTVYIVADHGDLLGDDGVWGHGGDVHPKLLEVPILIFDNGPGRELPAGTLLDIGPTIVTRAGYKKPDCWIGSSLDQPHDFRVNVFSAEDKVRYPFGILTHRADSFRVDLLNNKKKLEKTYVKQGNVWKEVTGN